MNTKHTPTIRLHLWLETDEGMFFGHGRAQLLQKIEEYGSLKKAAESMGISYRAAWGKIKKSEALLGVPLIEITGSKKEGCQLTPHGKTIKDKFIQWFAEVEKIAVQKGQEIFLWSVKSYNDQNQ
jgi:molybdate transport system regulatory protein